MVAGAHHELGGLDGVVYNVGIGAEFGLERADVRDTVMNVNVRGAMLAARAALPLLADGAAMVFISSVGGESSRQPDPGVRRVEGGAGRARARTSPWRASGGRSVPTSSPRG